MNWNEYTDHHSHQSGSHKVEIVAYERCDSGSDVFMFEPNGSVPEFEEARVDDEHIFITRIEHRGDLDQVAEEIDERLGQAYESKVYYRESGARRVIGHIQDHLQKRGAQHILVQSDSRGNWELVIRLKDFPLAGEVAQSNV